MNDVIQIAALNLLAAVGLIVSYGWFGTLNMAHGALLVWGAAIYSSLAGSGVHFLVAQAITALVMAVVTAMLDSFVVRRLSDAGPLSTLLGTWAVGVILLEALRLALGTQNRYVEPPIGGTITIFDSTVPVYNALVIGAVIGGTIALTIILKYLSIGLRIRAGVHGGGAAANFGIDASVIRTLCMAFAGSAYGIAGSMLAPINAVPQSAASSYTAYAFVLVVLGGRGVSFGPVLAAVAIGSLETAILRYGDPVWATPSSFGFGALMAIARGRIIKDWT